MPRERQSEIHPIAPCTAGLRPRLRYFAAVALGSVALAACAQATTPPPDGIALEVHAPAAPDDPFDLDGVAFVALTAEGPGVPENKVFTLQRYDKDKKGTGAKVTLPVVPFGQQRQIRVELWSQENGQPRDPLLGRGRSLPADVKLGGKPSKFKPYVTKINSFAPALGDDNARALSDARAGAVAVVIPNHGGALIIGGGVVKASSKNPYDIASFEKLHDTLLVYDTDARALRSLTDLTGAKLKVARAFAGVAVGSGAIVVAGGYAMVDGVPKPTKSVEYITSTFEIKSSTGQNPDMLFARARPTVVPMFDKQDYFLVLGGEGDVKCPTDGSEAECAGNTWEIWHPSQGAVAKGLLNDARWNHASVRLPGPGGGYAVLIGGENDSGPLRNFEVVQFSDKGGGKVSARNSGCPDAGATVCPPGALEHWKPFTAPMPVDRILPSAAYVQAPTNQPLYSYIYILGGFTDQTRTKAHDRIDVFDISKGQYLTEGSVGKLKVGRAAPMVAVSSGAFPGQVLVAGGSTSTGAHVNSAEFLFAKPYKAAAPGAAPEASIVVVADVENTLLGGNRALGVALALPTGHVLVVGGVGTTADGLKPQTDVMLWNPF